jgi:hypothetical protein
MENIQSAERASGIEPVALEDPIIDPNEELLVILGDANGGLGMGPDASITRLPCRVPCILRVKHILKKIDNAS